MRSKLQDYKSDWIAKVLSIPTIKHEQVKILHKKFQKTGNVKYRDEILLAHLKLTINPANYYSSKLSDDLFWDLINSSTIGIIKAIDKWDSNRGSYFYKFVKLFIWRACYTTFHSSNNATHHPSSILSKKEHVINFNVALDLGDFEDNLTKNSEIDQILDKDDYTVLTAGLTKEEKKIIDLYIIDELPWIKISKIMGMSPKNMLNVHRKIFAKIRENHNNIRR